jgi:hypothetical protein
MKYTSKQLVENALESTCNWIRKQDYNIRNESEFCNIFFYNLLTLLPRSQIKASQIHSEIKQFKTGTVRRRVESSIDFGLAKAPNGREYDLFLEAKTWIRPTHLKGPLTPNSSTSKRRQCVSDSNRLCAFVQKGICQAGGLIIFEQGSTHLRRCVPKELSSQKLYFEEQWLDIGRLSMSRRKEHLGLIWVYPQCEEPPNNSFNSEPAIA